MGASWLHPLPGLACLPTYPSCPVPPSLAQNCCCASRTQLAQGRHGCCRANAGASFGLVEAGLAKGSLPQRYVLKADVRGLSLPQGAHWIVPSINSKYRQWCMSSKAIPPPQKKNIDRKNDTTTIFCMNAWKGRRKLSKQYTQHDKTKSNKYYI